MIDINKEYEGMTWNDVIGGGGAAEAIKGSLEAGTYQIPQVVLFSGPYGCGKNLHAYLLSQELENVVVHVRNTVDNTAKGAEELIKQYSAPPFVPTTNQVCILNEFTLFRKDAQAKFKDIFQAPPARTYFFVCTNEPEKIVADVDNRFLMRVYLVPLREYEAFELANKINKKYEVGLTKKKLLAIARGSKGVPRTIINTIKAVKNTGDYSDKVIKDMLEVYSIEDGNKHFIELFRLLVGPYPGGHATPSPKQLREKIEATNIDAEGIRYKMLEMIYKGYHAGAKDLYLALLPSLERGAEKHDLFLRFMRVLKIL